MIQKFKTLFIPEKREKLTITVLPGFDCNLRCKMCYNWEMPREEFLTTENWVSLVNSLNKYNSNYKMIEVSIGGGEPYLHKYVFDIMRAAKKNGFRSNISTNGFLLTKSIIDRSIEAGLTGISISLDSLNPEIHDKYRGVKGTQKRVMKSIEYIQQTDKLELSINTVLMKGNIDDVIPLAKWVAGTEKIAYNVQAVVEPFQKPPKDKWYEREEYKELWPTDKKTIHKVVDGLIQLKESVFKERMNNTVMQLQKFKEYFENPESFIKHKGCSLTDKDAITINPNGSVFICPFMDPVGNIQYTELKKVLNSKKTKNTIKVMNSCTKNCHHLMNCYYKDEVEA